MLPVRASQGQPLEYRHRRNQAQLWPVQCDGLPFHTAAARHRRRRRWRLDSRCFPESFRWLAGARRGGKRRLPRNIVRQTGTGHCTSSFRHRFHPGTEASGKWPEPCQTAPLCENNCPHYRQKHIAYRYFWAASSLHRSWCRFPAGFPGRGRCSRRSIYISESPSALTAFDCHSKVIIWGRWTKVNVFSLTLRTSYGYVGALTRPVTILYAKPLDFDGMSTGTFTA